MALGDVDRQVEGSQTYPGSIAGPDEGTLTLVDHFVKGVETIRLALANLRVKLTNAIADYATKPIRAALAIAAIVAAMIAMNAIYTAVKANAAAMAIVTFFQGLGATLKSLAAFFQVDTIITLVRLGDVFLSGFHVQLARIYDALGSLSGELGKDMSFIMVFTETGRALLHTAYALSGNSWIRGEAEFADTMSTWLSGLKGKYDAYMRDPEKIFVDIQAAVSKASREELDNRMGEVFAAISAAADSAEKAGGEIIKLIDELDKIKKSAPEEIQAAMDVWYLPFRADYDRFIADKWVPFWETTDKAIGIVSDQIEAHGIDIEALKRKIKTPYDFFAMIFDLPTAEERAELERTRAIMLSVLEDGRVDTDAFANAHRKLLADTSPDLAIDYTTMARLYLPAGDIPVPSPSPRDATESWYRGEY